MSHCMTDFGHAVLFALASEIRRHCVGEDSDAVTRWFDSSSILTATQVCLIVF